MDHRGLLVLTLLLGVYTLNECAAFEPICKGQSPKDYYNGFLVYLDLGYNNPKYMEVQSMNSTTTLVAVKRIEENTLCGLQTVCLSILRALWWQSSSPNEFSTLFSIPHHIMVILYNMNAVYDDRVVYPLWLFNLYVTYIHDKAQKLNTVQMFCVHKMIAEQLTMSMNGCPDGNRFAVTDIDHDEYHRLHFTNWIRNHFDNIGRNLRRVTAANKSYERIDSVNLLGGYASTHGDYHNIAGMTTEFGSSGQWGNVSGVFLEASYKATDAANLYTGMQGIREFRSLFSTLLKMVMLRMLCIHLLLVADRNLPNWNAAMLETVTTFVDKTDSKDDETFVKTFRVLGDERPSPEDFKAVIDCIRSDLATSSTAFDGCNVSMITEEDIPRIFNNVGGMTDIPAYLRTNYRRAVRFVEKVKQWLQHVDQEFIKSVLALAYPIEGNFDKDNIPSFCKNNNKIN